ncbi:MAG: hypothetical protein FJX51_08485 [Alphaproteobacteria bacterium]|nr:hypothetical protein [Alphaproteobacteria bacterium]
MTFLARLRRPDVRAALAALAFHGAILQLGATVLHNLGTLAGALHAQGSGSAICTAPGGQPVAPATGHEARFDCVLCTAALALAAGLPDSPVVAEGAVILAILAAPLAASDTGAAAYGLPPSRGPPAA